MTTKGAERKKSGAGPAKGARRKNTRFSARREEILVAAVRIINRMGVKGMTISAIAEELKLVPTAVSYYYSKKEAIAAECMLRAIKATDQLVTTASAQATAQERVRVFLRQTMDMYRAIAVNEHPAIITFAEVRALDDPGVNEDFGRMYRRMRAIFGEVPRERAARSMHNARTHTLMSQANWSEVWLTKKYALHDYPRIAERVSDILCRGIAANSGVRMALPDREAAPPARREGELSLESFLNAATILINLYGYKGASVSNISSYLNVTKGSFYHYVDAKHDLLVACFERTLATVRAAQEQAEVEGKNGFEVLYKLMIYLVHNQISGAVPLLAVTALKSLPDARRQPLLQGIDQIVYHIAGVISDGIADGSIRPVDPMVGAYVIFEFINGAADIQFFTPGLSIDQTLDFYRSTFIGGFFPDSGQPSSPAVS